jgi:alpha-tubulin suppressor-like RCC1 family protein
MQKVDFFGFSSRFWSSIGLVRLGCAVVALTLGIWEPNVRANSPLLNVQQMSAGGYHICALVNGGVQCWGLNNHGQLGNGTYFDSGSPTPVKGLESGVTAISSGGQHTCVIVSGTVKCWGYNLDGELGDGNINDSNVPVTVNGLSGVVAISAGGFHTCARTTSGSVRCWGWNAYGQLGDGTTTATNSGSPSTVSGLSGATMLSSGGLHTCALVNGAVKCWGANTEGELGDGSTLPSSVPVGVNGLSGITAISAGAAHTCAIQSAGTVKCWGYNANGQLGNNSVATTAEGPAVTVSGIASGATALAAGGYHTCAIVSGAQKCWGYNVVGQLGIGSFADSHVPVTVSGLSSGVSAASSGVYFSCALATVSGAHQIKCWGDNVDGEIGQDDLLDQAVPVAVFGLSTGATVLASGPYSQHSCAIVSGGAKCWGKNQYGELGNGSFMHSSIPVSVTGLASGVTAISRGYSHTCAVVSGKAMCWGDNANGQLGNGSTTVSETPVTAIASGVTAIAAGYSQSCAIVSGAVKCWGSNMNGELGDGSTTERHSPVAVIGLSASAVAISIGVAHVCAVLSNGKIQCWGYNSNGQLGNGTTTTTGANPPVTVSNIASGATAVAAGGYHTCAIVSHAVKCWGFGQLGQLGDGSISDSSVPVSATGLTSGIDAVYAGNSYSCALASGTGFCWGDTQHIGNTSGSVQTVPSLLPLGNTVTSIGAGLTHGCAIVSGMTLCVGSDYYGELGDGRTIFFDAPATVLEGDEIFADDFGKN